MNNRFIKNTINCNKERIIEILTIKDLSDKYVKLDLNLYKKEIMNKTITDNNINEIKMLLKGFDNKLECDDCIIVLNDKNKIYVENKT